MYWKNKKVRLVLLCLGIIVLGMVRYSWAFPFAEIKEGKVKFIGQVVKEPDVRQDGVRYTVKGENKVYFKYLLYPRYYYGDKLQVGCELKKPEAFDNFRYDRYLANKGIFAICNKAEVEKIGEGGNFVFKNLLWLKNKVGEKVNLLWHEPYAGFMAGILYGYRGGLGNLDELFSRTGITHIIAISGYNISIIASILITFFVYLLIPRKKAFWLIVFGVFLFVIFTGASASVVRAGVMGILVLWAKQLGRVSRVGNVLVFTAVVMVFINPLVLLWDAGFQLSFLSTLGLVYLSPLIATWFSKVPEFLGLRESLVSTISAIIFTLPLILFQFGRLSVVAVPVNILILWIIPFLMLGGFLAVIASFIFSPLGQVIAWLTWAGMRYVVWVVEWFGNLKFAAMDVTIPWWLLIIFYLGIIYPIWRKKLKS